MDKLKFVKFIVFLITFLLVFGTLALLGLIYRQSQTKIPETPHISSLGQPSGSEISGYQISNGNLYILVKHGGLPDRIIIYNPQAAAQIAAVSLSAEK